MPGPKRWREGAGLVLTGNLASVIGKNIVIVEIDFGNNFGIFGNNDFAGSFEKMIGIVSDLGGERYGGKKDIFEAGGG